MVYGPSGHSGITYNPIIGKPYCRAELYIGSADGAWNKSIYKELFRRKDELESAFGGSLDWQELPDRKGCRICVHYDHGLYEIELWDDIVLFLADNLANLMRVFKEPLDTAVKRSG